MSKKKEDRDIIHLKAQLKGEILDKFNRLKKFYGVDADAELIRIILTNEYRKLFEPNTRG